MKMNGKTVLEKEFDGKKFYFVDTIPVPAPNGINIKGLKIHIKTNYPKINLRVEKEISKQSGYVSGYKLYVSNPQFADNYRQYLNKLGL